MPIALKITFLFSEAPFSNLCMYLKKHIARMYDETSLDQIDVYLAAREEAFSRHWEKVETLEE